MTTKKTKLELTWPGKEERPKLEPRILIEHPNKSYHAATRREGDLFDNMLIKGDNLLALKALEADYAGSIKCVFIDPPYNTGSAFEHYDDGLEHSLWLSLMRDRLELLRRLLDDAGIIWITIDDNEAHYLKVLCDEIFGRYNFVSNVIWEKSDSPKMDSKYFSSRHDHVLVYAKNIENASIARIVDSEAPSHFNKVDAEGRKYYTKPLRAMGSGDDTREARPTLFFPLTAPDGSEILPMRPDGVEGRWRWSASKVAKEAERIEWVNGRSGWSPYYRIYAEGSTGRPPETIWRHDEVGSNRTSKIEVQALFQGIEPFTTPKPERLIQRVLDVTTQPGELVLDSFAGSGTTGAVAHKMGRRWIMVEIGDHAETHIVPRLRKVIDGEDQGGISEAVEWKGGGGFRYYTLAPSLLEKDRWGNWVIAREYNGAMLAEAMCKHLGFTYAPSQDEAEYWRHGQSSETDFLYVTTQSLTHEALRLLSEEVGPLRTLMICAKAFSRKSGCLPEPDLPEDTLHHSHQMRMGSRRLFAERGGSARSGTRTGRQRGAAFRCRGGGPSQWLRPIP
ncbi:site-specific DNA-methyltransferase [Edaphosphingomonas haloaromaticamans]|uniref:site-specific DNA-methyltransferase (adenine-specific) n=1 Tax=Edaphosphingomonas haloaromaticamans TaxID=653954 RepID=A0A1S1HHH5_9SPHN|nr:site-specific DNA-methyltransferase [Sphingomonas haloaromaticamans]OHT20683.1 DNA adenine methyltransferase YhdJ [Sphingomonas haloaromaticamans]